MSGTALGMGAMAASCMNLLITDLTNTCGNKMDTYLSPVGCRDLKASGDPMFYAWCVLCCMLSSSFVYCILASFGGLAAGSAMVVCCLCLLFGPYMTNVILFNRRERKTT